MLNIKEGVDNMADISKEQRAHDVAMTLFEKYIENQELKCDVDNIDAHVKSYNTFYYYVLQKIDD